jgi:ribosome-associated protein
MADTNANPSSPAGGSQRDDALDFAVAVARIAVADKTEDVVVLDLRGLSSLTDFFVIGTGSSDRQMHAVLDHVADHARAVDRHPFRIADTRTARWVLVDYVDVVVHLFDAEHRAYYDLDGLWGDAPRVAWGDEGADGPEQPTE